MFLKINKLKVSTYVFTEIYLLNRWPTCMKSIKFEIINHVNFTCYVRKILLEPLCTYMYLYYWLKSMYLMMIFMNDPPSI